MNSRRNLLLLAIPVIILLERIGYFATRPMVVSLALQDVETGGMGMSGDRVSMLVSAMVLFRLGTPFVGGALAAMLGPRIPLISGLMMCSVGQIIIAQTSSAGMATLAFIFIGLGQGLSLPALYTLLAEELRGPQEVLCSAAFILGYGAMNVGALLLPTMVEFSRASGFRLGFAVMAGLSLTATVLAVALTLLLRRLPASEAAPSQGTPLARPFFGSLTLMFLLALPYLGTLLSQILLFKALPGEPGSEEHRAAYTLNPTIVIASVALTASGLIWAFRRRHHVTVLRVLGVGLLIGALSALPLLWNAQGSLMALAYGVSAVAEPLVVPLAGARFSTALSPRMAALMLGIWFTLTSFLADVSTYLAGYSWTRPLVALCAIVAIALGLAFTVLGRRLDGLLFSPGTAQNGFPRDPGQLHA
ncbi:hypothetical protein OV208_26815 [Corallococcus sp. bb12-1]|uniref:hypothetical protein n=1 Tax=Corallococcus sp. bb12-1 TaxID=2996784 RepID=UPI002270C082|nr:hypothetical protein [Corallococcus sp. bb12-1]MCY1044958.1 hypothetical protein [Corallococcus sp. bb12-1]